MLRVVQILPIRPMQKYDVSSYDSWLDGQPDAPWPCAPARRQTAVDACSSQNHWNNGLWLYTDCFTIQLLRTAGRDPQSDTTDLRCKREKCQSGLLKASALSRSSKKRHRTMSSIASLGVRPLGAPPVMPFGTSWMPSWSSRTRYGRKQPRLKVNFVKVVGEHMFGQDAEAAGIEEFCQWTSLA